ncbi:MAG: PqqD family protein [Candidatus Hodarchaeota archaeon]
MLAMNSDTRLSLAEDVIIQSIPELDHYYAFNIKNGDHFQLNQTAYWVLEAIGSGVIVGELSVRFAEAFELNRETAEIDLCETIEFAMENNIIKEVQHEKDKKVKDL